MTRRQSQDHHQGNARMRDGLLQRDLVCLAAAAAAVVSGMLLAPLLAGGETQPDRTKTAARRSVDFTSDVLPIFQKRCFGCHGPDKQKSSYRLDVRSVAFAGGDFGEAAIVAGKSGESRLIDYV